MRMRLKFLFTHLVQNRPALTDSHAWVRSVRENSHIRKAKKTSHRRR